MAKTKKRGSPARVTVQRASDWMLALLRRGSQRPLVFVTLPTLVVLVAAGTFLLGRSTAPASFDQQRPPHVGVPAQARLVRREEFLDDRVQNWYYIVPGATHTQLTAYYRDQLAHDGWACFRTMTSSNITQDGKTFTGASVYITALRGNTMAHIYTADQEYGAFLLQHDLPEDAIGLKVSLETKDTVTCV